VFANLVVQNGGRDHRSTSNFQSTKARKPSVQDHVYVSNDADSNLIRQDSQNDKIR
jgi:hypothetical protein